MTSYKECENKVVLKERNFLDLKLEDSSVFISVVFSSVVFILLGLTFVLKREPA